MGWLFAVALGLHRKRRAVVLESLIPIAIGHAASVAAAVFAVLSLGLIIDAKSVGRLAGVVLILWAAWHGFRGHRGRPRVGMQTGMAGLALWSFLMATAHGSGLMRILVLLPICIDASPGHELMPGLYPSRARGARGTHH